MREQRTFCSICGKEVFHTTDLFNFICDECRVNLRRNKAMLKTKTVQTAAELRRAMETLKMLGMEDLIAGISTTCSECGKPLPKFMDNMLFKEELPVCPDCFSAAKPITGEAEGNFDKVFGRIIGLLRSLSEVDPECAEAAGFNSVIAEYEAVQELSSSVRKWEDGKMSTDEVMEDMYELYKVSPELVNTTLDQIEELHSNDPDKLEFVRRFRNLVTNSSQDTEDLGCCHCDECGTCSESGLKEDTDIKATVDALKVLLGDDTFTEYITWCKRPAAISDYYNETGVKITAALIEILGNDRFSDVFTAIVLTK